MVRRRKIKGENQETEPSWGLKLEKKLVSTSQLRIHLSSIRIHLSIKNTLSVSEESDDLPNNH